MQPNRKTIALPIFLAISSLLTACSGTEDALTAHSRPAATAGGYRLATNQLGRIMAESPIPDSAMHGEVAMQVARLWADYVTLATMYRQPDSTLSVDFTPLLDEGRYFAAFAVQQFRDSVLSLESNPTDAEVREYFDSRQPFTRLDLRRIALRVPVDASEAMRDSLFDEASELRERLAGGADFVEVARALSDEQPEERGRILTYQGHESVPPMADSALFAMRPGEISPVFSTPEAMLIYRLEQRRVPEFENARQITYERMVEERSTASQVRILDSLLSVARISIPDEAPAAAIRIAASPDMAEGAVSGTAPLARFADGSVTAEDVRSLFRARPDMRQQFVTASEDDAYDLLMELAADEVLVQTAESHGFGPDYEEREQLQEVLASQMSKIAGRYNLSHRMVTDPDFDMDIASENFLVAVLAAQNPVPWLSEFRPILDPDYPSRIDDRGTQTAANLARDLREIGSPPPPTTEPPDDQMAGEEESPGETGTAAAEEEPGA